jgi:replicative DNA helicase
MLNNNEGMDDLIINQNPHAADVFACVLQHGSKDPEIIFQFITFDADQMVEGIWFNLYRTIDRYFKLTGKIISEDEFAKIIDDSQLPEEEQENYIKLFSGLSKRKVKSDAFKFYIDRLKNKVMFDKSYAMLGKANQALASGLTVGQKNYKGYSGMRQYLTETMYDIDSLVTEYSPEGEVNEETDEALNEYANMKEGGVYISTGFSEVDKCTGGLFPGELWLWVGYTGEGKTFSCINIGHNAAYVQRKNVLYLTSETVRNVVIRRLISRHAKHLFGSGIDLTAWKTGKLPDESAEIMRKTSKDMKETKNEYGAFYVIQMPGNATTDYVAAALTRCQAKFNVDLCILDSINLLSPKKHRQSEYSEVGDMLNEIKKIIVSHNNGRGVPLISPWHTNRASWDSAKKDGYYTKSALAKTGEAERSADVIVTILHQNSIKNELKGSIIKSRDGQELEEFYLNFDFSQGYIGDSLANHAATMDLLGDLGKLDIGSDKNHRNNVACRAR